MAAPRPLVVIGAGGNALDVGDIVAAINARQPTWRLLGCLDDKTPDVAAQAYLPWLGTLKDASRLAGGHGPLSEAMFVNAIGSERTYRRRLDLLVGLGLPADRYATLVHPASAVSQASSVGHGVCVGFGVSVGGRAALGDHVWIGPGCVIGHDTLVRDGAVLAPRATLSGFVDVGSCSYVGTCASVRQRVTIGARALVGMGAVVLHDVPPETVVVGTPARPLRRDAP